MKQLIKMLLAAGVPMLAPMGRGEALSLDTLFGDVDGTNTSLRVLKDIMVPSYDSFTGEVVKLDAKVDMAESTLDSATNDISVLLAKETVSTNGVKDIVTNRVPVDVTAPFSEWEIAGTWPMTGRGYMLPQYNESSPLNQWVLYYTNSAGVAEGSFITTAPPNATNLTFSVRVGDVDYPVPFIRSGTVIYRNALGLATEDQLTGFVTPSGTKDIVTNSYTVGFSGGWTYQGSGYDPALTYSVEFGGYSAISGDEVYTWNLMTNGVLSRTAYMRDPHPLSISFTADGQGDVSATGSGTPITRNALGLATINDLSVFVTHEELQDLDTSYGRVTGITNQNQTIQYVVLSADETALHIQIPEKGMTKDWIVYVLAEADTTLVLPTATYWVPKESYTNAIPAMTPTALYFTQVADETQTGDLPVYSLGRQELQPVEVRTVKGFSYKKSQKKVKKSAP